MMEAHRFIYIGVSYVGDHRRQGPVEDTDTDFYTKAAKFGAQFADLGAVGCGTTEYEALFDSVKLARAFKRTLHRSCVTYQITDDELIFDSRKWGNQDV